MRASSACTAVRTCSGVALRGSRDPPVITGGPRGTAARGLSLFCAAQPGEAGVERGDGVGSGVAGNRGQREGCG